MTDIIMLVILSAFLLWGLLGIAVTLASGRMSAAREDVVVEPERAQEKVWVNRGGE